MKTFKKDYDKTEDDLKALQSVGQIIGEVLRQLDEERFIVKASSGPRYVVGFRTKIDKSKLIQGTRVSLDMTTLTIMRALPREVDPVVFHMKAEDPGDIQYSSVGGLNEQIRELREVIELPLINPELFQRVGIKAPKGVLLYGPPGTGKTLLARAVANNIDAAFLKVVASAIVDKYIGESARLIREMFGCVAARPPARATASGPLHGSMPTVQPRAWRTRACPCWPRAASPFGTLASCHHPPTHYLSPRLEPPLASYARDHQPCIIFMDEIDAIGGRRFSEGTSADREIQRTLMELLNQLDGFDALGKVKMICATNRPDVLDPALMRPGRLDRKVEIPLPNEHARVDVLKIHGASITKKGDIDYESVVKLADGFNAADLRNVCTEAGMFAIRAERDYVIEEDFMKAVRKVGENKKLEGKLEYSKV